MVLSASACSQRNSFSRLQANLAASCAQGYKWPLGAFTKNELLRLKSWPPTQGRQEMSCHRDGGRSQGDTGHSLPPVRRRGGFNFDEQLFPPPKR